MKQYKILWAISLLAIISIGCKSVANYPISNYIATYQDSRIIGNWKFIEDTDKRNFYEVRKAHIDTGGFHVKFWDRGGTNPTYEANMYFSKIGGSLFINVPYWEGHFNNQGYFFLRVLEVNADFTKMTTATLYDTTLRSLGSSTEVRERIAKNLNNPAYYYDTAHFYKVK